MVLLVIALFVVYLVRPETFTEAKELFVKGKAKVDCLEDANGTMDRIECRNAAPSNSTQSGGSDNGTAFASAAPQRLQAEPAARTLAWMGQA